jgi:hypothetical protein
VIVPEQESWVESVQNHKMLLTDLFCVVILRYSHREPNWPEPSRTGRGDRARPAHLLDGTD